MSLFADKNAFDPNRDSKMPVRRGPFWLVLRALAAFFSLLISRHPSDAFTWLRSLYLRRRPLRMAIPWLTFDAIRHIKANLPDDARVFEFGSGHSTLFWHSRGAHVTSVGDDEAWYELMNNTLTERGIKGCQLVHAPTLDTYVGAIARCQPQSLDLILVDGAHRRDCVAAAIPFLKPGGMLVVDNTDWHWFRETPIEGIPSSWGRNSYSGYAPMLGHFSETTVWQRPSEDRALSDR
ncbi:MAG: hypothetical protein AB7E72_05130 [Lysobacterales bacterium]